jgi:hypothetical protein
MVQVRLNVEGEPGGPRHYRWNYEETWEIQAYAMAQNYFGLFEGDYENYYYTLGDYEEPFSGLRIWAFPNWISPYFYCWKYVNSRQLLLASTDLLTENSLRNHVLYEFEVSNDRISRLYHTKIYQYAIGEEAYYYFENMRSNTDETGSIFAPIPSEMEGNVECVTSPDIPVIGYVEVSRQVEREVFLNSHESPYMPPRVDCQILSYEELESLMVETNDKDRGMLHSYYPVTLYEGDMSSSYFATIRCIDCRTQGGTKTRPDWWPNDHY